jgi:hypothetical protein
MTAVLGDQERAALRREIAAHGLEADPFVVDGPWVPTWGLNLAVGWPLPVDRPAYRALAGGLAALDPALYVYPHPQTHVTVLTLVSFKDHVDPSAPQIAALEALIPAVDAAVAPIARALGPIELEIGAPVLARRAVFLPIADPAGALARFRQQVLPALRACSPAFDRGQPPRAVHSTLARFRAVPGPGFERRFDDWALGRALGPMRVDAMLMTTETRPYMRAGEIVATWPLGGR